jgi:prevent-host-death family protein
MLMTSINVHEAKTHLSRYLEAVETGVEKEIVIARNGRPVAKLVAVDAAPRRPVQLGLAKGTFRLPDDFDADNDYIAKLMTGELKS